MNHSDIQSAFEWRYAVKRFDPTRKISEADWKTLAQSLIMAPSSYGAQPYRFLVVENPAVREQLKAVSWNQSQVTDASHYVVILSKEAMDEAYVQKYITRMAQQRGLAEGALEGFKGMLTNNLVKGDPARIDVWAQRQAYIPMGFLLQTAALLKIDACPMEGFDPVAVDKILGVTGSGWKTVATVALGYRHAEDGNQHFKKVRFADEDLIQFVR